jgi:hypothetical protein
MTLEDSDRALILETLEQAGWIVGGPRGAAAKLGLKRTTLLAKMRRLGISRPISEEGTSVPGLGQKMPRFEVELAAFRAQQAPWPPYLGS